MRTIVVPLLSLALLAAATTVSAQEDAGRDTTQAQAVTGLSNVDRILGIIDLPAAAEKAREAGISKDDVRIILDETRRRKLPPQETEDVLEECRAAAAENGPVDNFGSFVRSRLDAGLRGKELAAAIHEEHRLHGKGKGKGQDKGQGRPEHPGQGKGQGKDRESVGGDHRGHGDDAATGRDEHDREEGSSGGRQKDKGKERK